MQVDNCIAKYLWMQNMVQKMAERKKQGLPMPTSIAEVEDQLGMVPGAPLSTIPVRVRGDPCIYGSHCLQEMSWLCLFACRLRRALLCRDLATASTKNIQTWRRQLPAGR